jgi:glyoxylase-like metal-dependent hydrolase (beta-lactamase superfamily II)
MLDVSLLVAGSCTAPERLAWRPGRWRRVEFPALVVVIRHPARGVVLFDTGYPPGFDELTRRFPASLYAQATPVTCGPEDTAAAQLAAAGVPPETVSVIVVSHLHADHVGGARDFPGARFVLGREALARIRGPHGSAWAALRHGLLEGLLPEDLDERAVAAEDHPPVDGALPHLPRGHDLVGDGSLTAVPLPGHAPGHLGLLVRGGPRDLFLVGDATWSTRGVAAGELPHPLVRLVTEDWAAYRRTTAALQRLAEARPDLLIVPSHAPDAIARARSALAGPG